MDFLVGASGGKGEEGMIGNGETGWEGEDSGNEESGMSGNGCDELGKGKRYIWASNKRWWFRRWSSRNKIRIIKDINGSDKCVLKKSNNR